jgi:hypothetical protein
MKYLFSLLIFFTPIFAAKGEIDVDLLIEDPSVECKLFGKKGADNLSMSVLLNASKFNIKNIFYVISVRKGYKGKPKWSNTLKAMDESLYLRIYCNIEQIAKNSETKKALKTIQYELNLQPLDVNQRLTELLKDEFNDEGL